MSLRAVRSQVLIVWSNIRESSRASNVLLKVFFSRVSLIVLIIDVEIGVVLGKAKECA